MAVDDRREGVAGDIRPCDTSISAMSRNPLSHTKSDVKPSCLREGNSVELDVAAARLQHAAATYPTHSSDMTRERGPFMDATRELTPDEARPYIVDMLDAVRKQEELCALNKARYILLARKNGMRLSEIAELLDMSPQGVGKAIKRIAQSMPEWAA